MINGITIENFKGIREQVEIELRPLTLLFGANSAGKSSILQALQYAAEVFGHRNLDAKLGGDGAGGIDLGGFQNFVHQHDTGLAVKLGITLGLRPGESLPEFSSPVPEDFAEPSSLFRPPATTHVELEIAWSEILNSSFVRRYAVGINGSAMAEINHSPGRRDWELLFNKTHDLFITDSEHMSLANWLPGDEEDWNTASVMKLLMDGAISIGAIAGRGEAQPPYTNRLGLRSGQDAFPNLNRTLLFDSHDDFSLWDEILPYHGEKFRDLAAYLTEAISQLVVGPARLIRDELSNSRFLGPIREVPPRNYTRGQQPDRAGWWSGLRAWDRLESADDVFIDAVSDWLGDENRLNSGYRLRLKRYKELDLSEPLVIQLLTGRAFDEADTDAKLDLSKLPTQTRVLIAPTNGSIELCPGDVGVGISQVVPVIVLALDSEGILVAIEQPEFHLHPKLQAELSDLFIESALGERRHTVLLETHSELIPLRLMRRIRENAEGTLPSLHPSITADDVAIYFIEMHQDATIATRLELSERGELLDPWPEGFFEEGFRERFSS